MSSTTQSQNTEVRTEWIDEISNKYHAHEDYIEEKLGYNPMIRDIIQTHGTNITVLDYGCGPGKVSRRLLQAKITKVEAVDISNDMVHLAKENSAQGSITFRKINSAELPFADGTIDAAICCFVLMNLRSRDEFEKVIREIYRTLKPAGTLYILDCNSQNMQASFSTFRCGDPGVVYHDGDPLPAYLLVPGQGEMKVMGTYWSKNAYESILNLAGFAKLQTFEYKSDDIPESQRHGLGINEKLYAPFYLFKATKPN